MNTINAKYLRNNLKEIIDSVLNENKMYTVIYRSKPVLQISRPVSYNDEEKGQKMIEILEKIRKNKYKGQINHPSDDKDLYREMLKKKHG